MNFYFTKERKYDLMLHLMHAIMWIRDAAGRGGCTLLVLQKFKSPYKYILEIKPWVIMKRRGLFK